MAIDWERVESNKDSYIWKPKKNNRHANVNLYEVFSTQEAMEYEQKNSPYNQEWKVLNALGNGVKEKVKGVIDFVGMLQDLNGEEARKNDPNYELNPVAQAIRDLSDSEWLKPTPVASASTAGQFGLNVAQGFGYMAPDMLLGAATRNNGLPALSMGMSIAGNEYDELREQGVDVDTAAQAAATNAIIQMPFEYIGFSKIFKRLPVNSTLKGYAREFGERVLTEGVTEFIQEYPEQITKIWALNEDKPIEDVAEIVRDELGNITSDAAYSGLIGAVLGGGLGGAHMGLSSSFQHAMTKEIHNTKMGIVEKQIENITATETNPAVAATVINSTTNNEMVYVDGSTVQEYAQTSGNMRELAIVLGVQEEDIKRAATDGDYLDVRLGNFEAAAAKYNGFFQAVKDDTSFEDGGYTVNGEKLYKQEIEQVKRKTAELEVEQDNVLNSMLTAGVERKQANALLTILTNHAMMMHPENPAQWMRENGLKFQKGGSTKGLAQSAFDVSKRGVTKLSQFGEKLSEVQARGEQPSSIKWIDPKTGYFFSGEQIQHSINTHKLTPKDLDDAYSGLGKYYDVWTSKVEEGRFHGQPIFARIKGNGRDFYVSLEITPNGEVHVLTIAPTNDGLYNDYKKTHGSKSLTPEGAESDGNHVLVMDSIYDALGIVKYNQLGEVVESQKADVRTKYEGTDQWMKAPNGKTTNLTEDQWLAVRTPAFKEWFGDWEKKPKQASKIVDENGEPLVVYHGTPLGGFTEFKRELNYFTADKEYADRYQDPGASSDYVKGVHEELGDAMTYPVFLNIRKPFDTRKAKERKIFENEFYRQWGNGAPLSEKGLPDWTDSDDFREFFEENEYDYDGLLLDEGGVPGEDGEVKSRGISYVAFESTQIKSATDNNGNFDGNDPNIYHQSAWHGSPYDFNEFDLGAIGSGEGIQAHGWGLYFAGNREVSEGYRERLSEDSKEVIINGETYFYNQEGDFQNRSTNEILEYGTPLRTAVGYYSASEGNVNEAIKEIKKDLKESNDKKFKVWGAIWNEAIDILVDEANKWEYKNTQKGKLFEVDIPESDVMLDEQKPFSEQPEKVQKGVKKALDEIIQKGKDLYTISHLFKDLYIYENDEDYDGKLNPTPTIDPNVTGERIYSAISSWQYERLYDGLGLGTYNDEKYYKATSELLNKHGIQGITYEGGRDGRCYVVFDDKAVRIIEKYNQGIKGAFNPEMQDGQYIISLFKGADASTVIHETGHYFIETMWKAVESGQATKQVEKDFDTLLEYAGMTREQWAAADVKGRTAAHEKLAEAFESYIMEGKAPSEQLREAFRKFAEWLKAVYQTIRRSENAIPLTDDVRQVFDRMLAAQDDIAEAERVNKYFAELPKAITENMSEATKARVEKFIDNAREKALDVLTRKAMENFSSERQEEISNYRAEILPEVTEEIKERRTYKNGYTREDVKKYQALQDIVTGENEVGKELTPEDEVYMMQFDLTAESFGYSSTNEMVQDIMNSPTEKQAITQAVNELVNARFPDYMTEKKAREEAIQEAIYNDENGLLIGVEQQLIEEYATKAMNRQMEAEAKKEAAKVEGGEKKQGPAAKTKEEMRIRAAAYRQQAKTMAKEAIGRMIISDATRTQKYVTLERRAAMKSAECMAKKDYREALTQKNLQAYYHAMVQESIKAKRTVDKNRRYLKRQVKAKKEAWVSEAHFAEVSALFMRMGIAHKKHDDTGRIGVTLREYADAMNEKYDCAEFADWLLNMPDYEPLSDTRMYTLEQFNDMVDAVRNIRAIAKAEKGVGMFEKAKSFEELKKDILENLDKLKTVFTPDPNRPTQATLTERFWAALENSDTFFERMDNWSQGFFTNTFFAKIKHSNDMEYDCREKYDKAVIEANNEWLPDKAAMAAAEEKIYYEELGTSVSKHILVKMLMNMGNKENARRLAETCPIGFEKGTIWNPMSEDSMLLPEEALELTQHNILEFLQNNLTAEDVRYAQKMVNAAGSFWTEKNEMEKRVKGFGLKKVEATPQVLTIGGKEVVFQGGYFPLIRNGELGSHPVTQEVGADDPLQGRNIRTLHTNSGSTKHRTLGAKYPVNLFPGAETQVMYDSIHDLCWRECVNDFRRVLNDGDIYTALKTKLGPARMSVFREMLEKAAQPNSTQSADFAERTVGAAASWLRNKSANAIIMMNLKINLQNFGNVFLFGQSVEGFGHADTLHALGNFKMNFADAKGYSDLTEFIFSKSAFMRERMTIPDISVRDIMEDPTNKQSEFEKSVLRLGTKLMVYTDGITAKPVWLEAYRKSLANGKTEQEAVDFADTVIRRTLGSTRMTDVSSLQRGGAIYKLMTMFQSFFNTQYNQWVREKNLVQKMYTEGQKREAFENAFAFVTSKFVFTCMASLALSLKNPFGIDDDDGWPELLKEMKNYSFSMFGPVGQVGSNLVGNMLGMKEFGYRMSVVQSTLEKMTRTGKTVNKVVTGESKTPVADIAETTTDVAGFVLGVPQQVNKVLWNTYDILVNDMDPRLEDLTRRRPKKERKPDK